jgi:hypothetical protein
MTEAETKQKVENEIEKQILEILLSYGPIVPNRIKLKITKEIGKLIK